MFGSCDGQPLNQNRNGKTEMLFIDKENARHTESRDETNTVSEPWNRQPEQAFPQLRIPRVVQELVCLGVTWAGGRVRIS